MKYIILILCTAIFFSCTSRKNLSSANQQSSGDLLIENINIVDVENNRLIPQQDVLIRDKRISEIFSHATKKLTATVVVNGKDKYLLPGLWDMHVHTLMEDWYTWQFPLFVANGIIGFRDMWGNTKLADSVRAEMQKGSLPFLHFTLSGHILDGKKPFWPRSLSAGDTITALRIVDSLIDAKVDFIKVYSFLESDVFEAIAKRCRERNFLFAGHVPHRVWLTKASDAGIASMEHLYGFHIEACAFPDSAMQLKVRDAENFEAGIEPKQRQALVRASEKFVLENFSEERMRSIAKTLRKNDTYVVPTMVTLRGNYFRNDPVFTNDERLKYMSKGTRDFWRQQQENDFKRFTEEDWQNKRTRYAIEKKMIKILWQEKVPILAGTDSDNPFAFPAFSLHDEMALFVEFGMTPVEALRTATINPIKYLKMTDSLGSITTGKRADIVLLNGNPLTDISQTKNIHAVILNGKLYKSDDLDKLKDQVIEMNSKE
jgi:hypothetical protein